MLVGILLAVFGASPAAARAALTDDDLRNIPSPGHDLDIHTGKLLAPILIPRVPGTEGSYKTQKHFVDFFKTSLPSWGLSWQNSTSKTPLSGSEDVPFSNLIFSRDPPGSHPGDVPRLTLVAHFDTLVKPEGFVGAIDSAAPCAMLLHVARSIDAALTKKWKDDDNDNGGGNRSGWLEERQGVQIIFLDGEEAFLQWSATDSLYGARSLAQEWDESFHPALSTFRTPLESISLFVLLDLLGSPDPSIPSYFLPTHWAYQSMAALEARMRALNLLESKPTRPFLWNSDKKPAEFTRSYIEDDHIPFMQRGVDVLHIIPDRFPPVWHKLDDDGEHLDLPTTRDWARIVTAFVVEYMDLGGLLDTTAAASAGKTSATESVHSKRTEL